MRTLLIAVALCVLIGLSMGVQAQGIYFAQDDFCLIYGQPNQPGSAGAQFTADGRLVNWDTNTVAAWFTLSGTNTESGSVVGSQYKTIYDSTILTITTMPLGNGTILWQGSGSAYTLVNLDQSGFDATLYDRPDWYNPTIVTSGYVSNYQSVGAGSFAKTAGTWQNSEYPVEWFGTYDWNFIGDGQGNELGLTGNMQGKLVPEPSTLMACLTGLLGCAGMIKRRRS